MTSTQTLHPAQTSTATNRREVWTGILFPVLFVASNVVSSPPADNASTASWIANYTGRSEQARHLATAVLLVAAGLCLAGFFTALWRRIRDANPAASPLPLVAAAASAGCISAGGVVMGYVSGGELIGKYPLPRVDLLRLSNDLGFALVSVGGMIAAALAVAALSVQGRAAHLFGRRTYVFGLVTAVVLLGAIAFIPIVILLAWTVVLAVQLLRS